MTSRDPRPWFQLWTWPVITGIVVEERIIRLGRQPMTDVGAGEPDVRDGKRGGATSWVRMFAWMLVGVLAAGVIILISEQQADAVERGDHEPEVIGRYR
jgi:hypothetical protein